MIYMEYGQQAEQRLLSSQDHRSLSTLWKELLGSSIPPDKWLMTPCKWARDNLHWYISAHLKCKLCCTHRHRGSILLSYHFPQDTGGQLQTQWIFYSAASLSLSMWSCLFNPCHGVYGVILSWHEGSVSRCHTVTRDMWWHHSGPR